MKTTKILDILILGLVVILWSTKVSEAEPMGTAFTYQGYLKDVNGPNGVADGDYDFKFELYDNCVDGNQVGDTVNKPDCNVSNGYFTVELDFSDDDPNAFNGNARWLKISVRQGELNDPNEHTPLDPRVRLTPTPYAICASALSGVTLVELVQKNEANSVSTEMLQDGAVTTDKIADGAVTKVKLSNIAGYSEDANISAGNMISLTSSSSGGGVYGESASGKGIHGKSGSGYAGYFEGNVHVTGEITKNFNSQADLATPIAYGVIDSDGAKLAGTANVSSEWNGGVNQRYEITISGEEYSSSSYVTVVTPIAGSATPRIATTDDFNNKLIVRIFGLSTSPLQSRFHFVTYKP